MELSELGNLDVRREFNDVRSICDIYLELLECGKENEVYNICSGNTYSLADIIALLTQLSGHELEVKVNPAFVRKNEVRELYGDPGKLQECIGELNFHSLEDTLKWMLDSQA